MHYSSAKGLIAVLAIMLAAFAGLCDVPARAMPSGATEPTAASDDEIVVITAAGQLRVDDPFTPNGYMPVSWNSGSDLGWTVVAGGDFNGDGDAEIVAGRGSFVKVFDPVVQPGKPSVAFSVELGSQRNVRLLTTGDFDADGRDEFAVMHYIPGKCGQAGLQVYDGGTNVTRAEWTRRNYAEYAAMFQDMSVGDFNADGADDLVMVRNASNQYLALAWNVRTWSSIAMGSYARPWYAVTGGNLSLSNPGDEISLTQDGADGVLNNLMLFRVVSGAFTDLVSNPAWRFYPDFVSLSAGDLNGDGDDEVMLLRDPVEPRVSLLMVNPVGVAMNAFEQVTGAGSAAFKIVRTGDMDGDGRDEIVILKGDRYRIYTEPNVDSRAMETLGSYYAPGTVSNLPFMALANVDGGGQPFGPTLGVPPTSLSFDLEHNQPSPTKIVSITNLGTSDVLDWQAEVIAGAPWLLLNSTSGTTSGTLSISVDTTAIGPGSYTGKIRISATGGGGPVQSLPQEVTVNVTSNDGATTTFTPTSGYGEIRGVVWLDRNGDQLVDVSEPGLTDVQVCLLQEDFQIRTAITGADGEYRFTMLTPGRYQVSEVQPADLRFSSTPDQGVIDLAADETSVVNFGDWNGRSTYAPLILR